MFRGVRRLIGSIGPIGGLSVKKNLFESDMFQQGFEIGQLIDHAIYYS